MELSAVFSKTPKGLRARASLIGGLSSHLMKVLTHVDGASKAETILLKFDKLTPQQLSADLIKLEQEGYIRLATVTTASDDDWALTTNFTPMVVEEYQSAEELEALAIANIEAQKTKEQAALHLAAEQKAKQEEERELAVAAKAEKKAQKLRDKEKAKAETKVKAQLEQERIALERAKAAEVAEAALRKAEVEAKLKAQQEAETAAQQLAAERAARLADEARQKAELKAREVAEQAEADAEAAAKEQARSEIERISREAEEAQRKADLDAKAIQEAKKAAAETKARTEKVQQQAQLALAMKAEQEAKARLDITNVLRKAEEDRKKAAADAKAEKLEAKRLAKAEQEAHTQAERKAKEEAQALAKQLKLNVKAEEKAKAEAAENALREQARIAKEAELISKIELVKAQVETQEQLPIKGKAQVKPEAKVKDQGLLPKDAKQAQAEVVAEKAGYTVQAAQAKLTAEELANIAAKENARLEMERIGREADLARQNFKAQPLVEEVKKGLPVLDDFDVAEAAEEAAFEAKERTSEAEENSQKVINKADQQATEDAGRAGIKEAARAEAEANASAQSKTRSLLPTKIIKQWLSAISKGLFIYVPVLLLVLLALAHFVNLSALIKPIEQLAANSLGVPVEIKKVHASLWPQPHLVLEDVLIGNGQNVKVIHVLPATSSLFEEVKIAKSLVIEGLTLEQANFDQPLQWVNSLTAAKNLKVEQINIKNLTLAIRDLQLEPFDGKVIMTGAGTLDSIDLVSSNNALSVTILPQGSDYEVALKAANWPLPFNQKIVFSTLNAKGSIAKDAANQNQIKFNQIEGEIYGGSIVANASLAWPSANNKWLGKGDFKLSNANAEQILSNFGSTVVVDGKLTLSGNFSSNASQANALAQAAVLNANFEVRQGGIKDIELGSAVLKRGAHSLAGNTTQFDKLTGSVKINKGQYQYGKLVLVSPQLQASGYLNINTNQNISGKLSASLAAQSRRMQASFGVVGRGKDLKSQ